MPPNQNNSTAASEMMAELLRRARSDAERSYRMRESNLEPAQRMTPGSAFSFVSTFDYAAGLPLKRKEPVKKEELKKRHLTKQEREVLHKPASDWVETQRGETCKNACSLEISDLVSGVNP